MTIQVTSFIPTKLIPPVSNIDIIKNFHDIPDGTDYASVGMDNKNMPILVIKGEHMSLESDMYFTHDNIGRDFMLEVFCKGAKDDVELLLANCNVDWYYFFDRVLLLFSREEYNINLVRVIQETISFTSSVYNVQVQSSNLKTGTLVSSIL